jgi:diguanylate cyclase (GGDEF)-like protein
VSPGFDAGNQAGVCGRDTFSLALGHRLAELGRTRVPLSVILVRVDDFRELCNAYGSHAGSLALQALAKFFTAALRDMDWVARLDTTTFAVLLPGANLVNTTSVAERLRTGVAQASLRVDRHVVNVTISTGAAEASESEDGNTLMQRAEKAMQIAIAQGGNCSHSLAAPEPNAADTDSLPNTLDAADLQKSPAAATR